MIKSRPPSATTGQAPPSRPRRDRQAGSGERRRLAGIFSLTAAITLCALAACALFVPVTVFGAQRPSPDPGPEFVVETTASLAAPSKPVAAVSPAIDGASPIAAASDSLDGALAPSAGSLLVTLPWGSGAGEVGLVQPGEGLTRGPEALAVAPDGRIAVLDSVNKRVVFLSPTGQIIGSARVSLAEPRFLAVTDTRVYVLDCDGDRRLQKLGWSGASYGLVGLPALPDVVSGLFATSDGPCVEVAHDQVFRITAPIFTRTTADFSDPGGDPSLEPFEGSLTSLFGRPADSECTRLVKLAYSPGADPLATSFVTQGTTVVTETAALDMSVPVERSIEHLVSVDGDLDNGVVVGARLIDLDDSAQGLLLLRRFVLADNGVLTPAVQVTGQNDSLLLLDWSFAYVGQPYTVAPDGRVFQPMATDGGYSIFVHAFGSGQTTAQTGGM